MTDDEATNNETAYYYIYVLDLNSMLQEAADGIEVAATMKSLVIDLHQIVLGNREVTPEDIHYSFIKHVSYLLQFAKMATTIAKLQKLLETLQRAKSALEQDEDAEQTLRDAWQLMRSVLSQEEIEKISASQIELRCSGIDPILISVPDVWEQANLLLQQWSTPENEGQQIEYVVSYRDGSQDGRRLKLPLFYKPYSGEPFLIGPQLHLGKQIIAALEKSIDQGSGEQTTFDAARDAALAYLRRYQVGCEEATTDAILRIQDEQWSPNIIYRRSLHSEHN